MKRALKFIALGLISLVLLLGISFSLVSGKLVENYRPEIERVISSSLGTPVSIGRLNLSLFPSLALSVSELSLGASKDLGVDEIRFKVNLFSLMRGVAQISEISVIKPRAVVQHTSSGVVISGLDLSQDSSANSTSKVISNNTQASEQFKNDAAVTSPIEIDLKLLQVVGGQFDISTTALSVPLIIRDLNLALNPSLQGSTVRIPGLDLGFRINDQIGLTGRATDTVIDINSKRIESIFLDLAIDDSRIALSLDSFGSTGGVIKVLDSSALNLKGLVMTAEALGISLPISSVGGVVKPSLLVEVGLSPSFSLSRTEGIISLSSVSFTKTPLALSNMSGDIKISDGDDQVDLGGSNFTTQIGSETVQIALDGALSKKLDTLKGISVSLSGLGGQVKASSDGGLNGIAPLSNSFSITDLSVSSILRAVPIVPTNVEGSISSVVGNVSVTLNERMLETLDGSTKLDLRNLEISGINYLAKILNSLKVIPLIGDALLRDLPTSTKALIESPNTRVSSILGAVKLDGDRIVIDPLTIDATILTIRASGSAFTNGSLSMKSRITFNSELSSYFVSKTKELSELQDQQGLVVLPFIITMKDGDLIIAPDVDEVMKLVAGAAVRSGAKQLINKALGKSGSLFGF